MELVLVYLSPWIPRYVIRNLKYLSHTFPDFKTILVSDSPFLKLYSWIYGFQSWKCSASKNMWGQVSSVSKHSSKFRGNFWFKTVARFYALHEYMNSRKQDTRVLHIEADVWLAPNFPLAQISNLDQNVVAYPIKSREEGIASTLYLGSKAMAAKLVEFSEECFETNPLSTDVSILGQFAIRHESLMINLPTAHRNFDAFRTDITHSERDLICRQQVDFGGIFDASTFGIFLTGKDPRGDWGRKWLFAELGHPIDCRRLEFDYTNGSVRVRQNEIILNLFSLHIHSKDLSIFNIGMPNERIRFLVNSIHSTPKLEFRGLRSKYLFLKTFSIEILLSLRNSFRELIR